MGNAPSSPDFLLELVDELPDPVPVLLVLLRLELQLLHAPLTLRAVLGVVRRHLHSAGQLEVKLQEHMVSFGWAGGRGRSGSGIREAFTERAPLNGCS